MKKHSDHANPSKRNDEVRKRAKAGKVDDKVVNSSKTGEEHELKDQKENKSRDIVVQSSSSVSSSVADGDNGSDDSIGENEGNGQNHRSASPIEQIKSSQSPAAKTDDSNCCNPSEFARRPLHGYPDSESQRKLSDSGACIKKGITFAIVIPLIAIVIPLIAIVLYFASSYGNKSDNVCQQFRAGNNFQVAATSFIGNASKDLHFLETREASVIIRSQIESLGRSPYKPSCILFSLTDDVKTKDAFTCLGKYLNCFLSGNREASAVYSSHHKATVDDQMIAALDNRKAVTLYNIDEMDLETAMLLYKFCDDNDEPQYPGSMVLLTINSSTKEKLTENELEQRLAKVWSSQADELTPLLSRIANSILTFSSEGFETCSI